MASASRRDCVPGLEALAARGSERLAAFLVTREEYETLLWPEMPDREYTPFAAGDTGEEGVFSTFDVFVRYGRSWKLMNYDEL